MPPCNNRVSGANSRSGINEHFLGHRCRSQRRLTAQVVTRDIRSELPATANWPRLKELKAEWGVSIASLLRRARSLEVMSESAYVSATKVMSARGWRRHEPVDRDPEVPSLLSEAFRKARRQGLTAEDLRHRAMIPQSLFDEICPLIEG